MCSLIVASKVKSELLRLAKERYKETPSYCPNRVSAKTLEEIDREVLAVLKRRIADRPSKGKTI